MILNMLIQPSNAMQKNILTLSEPFYLERGKKLQSLQIAYHTAGTLNEEGNNVIWICHALTANSDVSQWWPGMIGEGRCFDPRHHFIICANIVGSCYGTTGPLSKNPKTGQCYYQDFPEITIRDMVKAHEHLRKHLGISRIDLLVGGSIGGFQALEWAIIKPDLPKKMFLLATSPYASPWAIAFNESQRMAIEADASFSEGKKYGGKEGMKAARSFALLSYRSYEIYKVSQADPDLNLFEGHRASSYQRHQGEKLVKRFNAYAYYLLTRAFDTHNVGRNRNGIKTALSQIKAFTLIVGLSSDGLFPSVEQKFLAEEIPHSRCIIIHSDYGHDGFLVEIKRITKIVQQTFKQLQIV